MNTVDDFVIFLSNDCTVIKDCFLGKLSIVCTYILPNFVFFFLIEQSVNFSQNKKKIKLVN